MVASGDDTLPAEESICSYLLVVLFLHGLLMDNTGRVSKNVVNKTKKYSVKPCFASPSDEDDYYPVTTHINSRYPSIIKNKTSMVCQIDTCYISA